MEKSGRIKTGAEVKAFFKLLKASVALGDHLKLSFLNKSVRGLLRNPYPLMNLLWYSVSPRNPLSCLRLAGSGNNWTASIFLGSVATPSAET